MQTMSTRRGLALIAILAATAPTGISAQQSTSGPDITVNGELPPEMPISAMTKGPEIKGTITARSDDRVKVLTADGSSTIIAVNETTKIKGASARNGLTAASLLPGLPVTVKTLQAGDRLLARQISFRKGDFKTANMIRNGTDQRFADQTAATETLRGRMGDIDEYNVKATTNVNFDTGKAVLSAEAKNELCATAQQAQQMDNALIFVVGYTDSTGSQEFNQVLSEKRAGSVINHLQQACGWKPYRVLTPAGMAASDPLADNTTPEGKAQNRRVAVNVMVSKTVDGF